MTTNLTSKTLADLATTYPAASRIFHRLGLDYCCGGQRTLNEACQAGRLDPAEILAEIQSENPQAGAPQGWPERPLAELADFIEARYHADLRRELPELIALAEKVEARHADKPTRPQGLAAHLKQVHGAVLDHLMKEERILFPMIRAGRGSQAAGPVQVMEHEHKDHAANLRRIRELAHDLNPPAEACTSWKALYLRLARLEADLMEHIHLENNVLFPRALCE